MSWQPAVDIYKTSSGWLLKVELAGVMPEDVSVGVEGSCITIGGVRRDWMVEESCTHYSMEIAYNRFARMIELPCSLEHARFNLEFRNGILLVRVTTEGRPA